MNKAVDNVGTGKGLQAERCFVKSKVPNPFFLLMPSEIYCGWINISGKPHRRSCASGWREFAPPALLPWNC